MRYDLWYWPGVAGRGEFVRLALEAGGIPYVDRPGADGVDALLKDMALRNPAPFAPPYIAVDRFVVAQTANILLYLSERHSLAPSGMEARAWLHQIQLTIADLVAEAHNVHHPVAAGLYYEDQKEEAVRAADQFRSERMPKFLHHFERLLSRNDGPWLTPGRWSHADLSLFQIVEGLRYAFPQRMATLEAALPRLAAMHDAVAELPELSAYFASGRRIAFSRSGIFRHYPELDAA